jgi:hypothetical protein
METTMTTTTKSKNRNAKLWMWTAAASLTAAAVLGVGGCNASGAHEAQVEESADRSEQNRMLVRWTLAENVYNGVAAERAVYPKDFDAGGATLNRLGTQRLETLVDASRNTTEPIVIVRGDAADELYTSRVETIRKELIAAGLTGDEANVARDTHVGGGRVSSDRALLTYQRLMSDYAPKQSQQQMSTGFTPVTSGLGSNSSGSSSNRGQ